MLLLLIYFWIILFASGIDIAVLFLNISFLYIERSVFLQLLEPASVHLTLYYLVIL